MNNIEFFKSKNEDSSLVKGEWNLDELSNFSIKVFSDYESVQDSKIVTKKAEDKYLEINNFSNNTIISQNNTNIIDDLFEGEDVELSLDERIINLIVDMSGSMSWNDSLGDRHEILSRFVERVSSTYPGDIKWNILSFNGTPITAILIAVAEQESINDLNISSINNSFFSNSSNNIAGFRVVRRTDQFPTSPIDGQIVSEGFLEKTIDENLEEDTNYYYKVFTFDKNGNFSSGIPIAVKTSPRVIPLGITQFDVKNIYGTGVKIDSNIKSLWHFLESNGSTVFDYSTNNIHLYSQNSETIWTSANDTPIGLSSIYFYNQNSRIKSIENDNILNFTSGNKISILARINPNSIIESTERSIIYRGNSSNYNYYLCQYNDKLRFYINSITYVESNSILSANEDNSIAVTYNHTTNECKFYINGVIDSTKSFSNSSIGYIADSTFTIGASEDVNTKYFRGYITDVSISDNIRSADYILENSENINYLHDGLVKDVNDNGDRFALIKWEIDNLEEYSNIKILRKQYAKSCNDQDGDIVYEGIAKVGENIIVDYFDDFNIVSNYYYTIFSINENENTSLLEDSPTIDIKFSDLGIVFKDTVDTSVDTIDNLRITLGNEKNYLRWNNPVLSNSFNQVQIYASEEDYPIISNEASTGDLVFSGDINSEKFVHRNIVNGKRYYYSVVSLNKYGNYSTEKRISGIPSSSNEDIGIPLLDVECVNYQLFNNDSIVISWKNPIEFKNNLTGYFDDNVYIYAALVDQFGRPIDQNINQYLSIEQGLGEYGDSLERLGFSPPGSAEAAAEFIRLKDLSEESYSFSSNILSNGIMKGFLSLSKDNNFLSNFKELDFEVKLNSNITSPNGDISYTYKSNSIKINLFNPWTLALYNRDNRTITRKCPSDLSGAFAQSLIPDSILDEDRRFDGAYIRSKNPFVIRSLFNYRGQVDNITTTVTANIYSTNIFPCQNAITNLEYYLTGPNPNIPFTSKVYPVVTEEIEYENTQTQAIEYDRYSYADIKIPVSTIPTDFIVEVVSNYSGFVAKEYFYVIYENILKLEQKLLSPVGDGRDVAEQKAFIYLINPDDPESGNITVVSDLTPVKWTILPKNNAKIPSPPFYSTDIVNLSGGVYSYTRGGTAKNVLFGPTVSSLTFNQKTGSFEGEKYDIYTSISYDGLTAVENKVIEVFPPGKRRNNFGVRMLFEMEKFKNKFWADGKDYVKGTIIHNPVGTPSNYGTCFIQCANDFNETIIPLVSGQIVEIALNENWEIIYGDDVEEIIDEYTGAKELRLGSNSTSVMSRAQVPISDENTTNVYFRYNKYLPAKNPPEPKIEDNLAGFLNPCECLGISMDVPESYEETVSVYSTQQISGITTTMIGGGGILNGVPPTVLVPIEPLSIDIVGIKTDGVLSDSIIIDGKTINKIVLKVSFSGKNVPEGTKVNIFTTDSARRYINYDKSIVLVKNKIDSSFDSTNEISYVEIDLYPISDKNDFSESIIFTCNYDESGTVENRLAVKCLNIKSSNFSESDNQENKQSDVFGSDLERYNIAGEEWESLAPMNVSRAEITLNSVNDKLYAIGGISSNSISSVVEEYNPQDDTWTIKSTMPSSRFGCSSVVYGSKIYIFGGLELNTNGQMQVSSRTEAYDADNDTWSVLENIPNAINDINDDSYGICFSKAIYSNVSGSNKIYIVGGIRGFINSFPSIYSTSVLIYDIDNDSWTASEDITNIEYQRMHPNIFIKNNDIFILGGAYISESYNYLQSKIIKYNIVSDDINFAEDSFDEVPILKYRASNVKVDNDIYIIGGSNLKSNYSNTFEKLNISSSLFSYEKLDNLLSGKSAVGASYLEDDYGSYIYVAGGFKSGRKEGFLQVITEFGGFQDRQDLGEGNWVRLDGVNTSSFKVYLRDQYGNPPESEVKIIATGILQFRNQDNSLVYGSLDDQNSNEFQKTASSLALDKKLYYPVVFYDRDKTTVNGECVFTLRSRSEDILKILQKDSSEKDTSSILIEENITRKPYDVYIQLTVIDDFYYGSTLLDDERIVVDTTDDNVTPEEDNTAISIGTDLSVIPNIEGGDEIRCSSIKTSLEWSGLGIGDNTSGVSGGLTPFPIGTTNNLSNNDFSDNFLFFNIIPPAFSQLPSPVVNYYSDINWVPSVNNIIHTSSSSVSDVRQELESLSNEVPFGSSLLLDSIFQSIENIKDSELENISNIFYIFTDNEYNLSTKSVLEISQEISSLSTASSPIILSNFSTAIPRTASSRIQSTDTLELIKLAKDSKGQSFSYLDSSFENDFVNIITGTAIGSIGYGDISFIYDFGIDIYLKDIKVNFYLPDNTNAKWSVYSSADNYIYDILYKNNRPDDVLSLSNIKTRYIKFELSLISGLSTSNIKEYEQNPIADSPKVLSIDINYVQPVEQYIYINKICNQDTQNNVVVAVDSDNNLNNNIEIGVSQNNSFDWKDYHSGAKRSFDFNGKTILPVRNKSNKIQREPLVRIDKYVYKMFYSKAEPISSIKIYNGNDIVSSEYYKVYYREGIIVLSKYFKTNLECEVLYNDCINIGLKITNNNVDSSISISGIGTMYNTDKNLGNSLSNIKPTANNVLIKQQSIDTFTTIEYSYIYSDITNISENLDKKEIRWYINNNEISWLRNVETWNNIANENDSVYRNYYTNIDFDSYNNISEIKSEILKANNMLLKTGDQVSFTLVVYNNNNIKSQVIKSNTLTVEDNIPLVNSVNIRGLKSNTTISSTVTSEDQAILVIDKSLNTGTDNSEIKWYLNGLLFKLGTLGFTKDIDRIKPLETGQLGLANFVLAFNNEIYVEYTPVVNNVRGETIITDTVLVANTKPRALNVRILPELPKTSQSLILNYDFEDIDVLDIQDANQSNQSVIKWYRSENGSTTSLSLVSELTGSSVVPPSYLEKGQYWKAEVLPYDGIDEGTVVQSTLVLIR